MRKQRRIKGPTVSICINCELEIIGKIDELPDICPSCKKTANFAFRYINKNELLTIFNIEDCYEETDL